MGGVDFFEFFDHMNVAVKQNYRADMTQWRARQFFSDNRPKLDQPLFSFLTLATIFSAQKIRKNRCLTSELDAKKLA
jgi:hypothetical protein